MMDFREEDDAAMLISISVHSLRDARIPARTSTTLACCIWFLIAARSALAEAAPGMEYSRGTE